MVLNLAEKDEFSGISAVAHPRMGILRNRLFRERLFEGKLRAHSGAGGQIGVLLFRCNLNPRILALDNIALMTVDDFTDGKADFFIRNGALILVNDVKAHIDDVDRIVLERLADKGKAVGVRNVIRIVKEDERCADFGCMTDACVSCSACAEILLRYLASGADVRQYIRTFSFT